MNAERIRNNFEKYVKVPWSESRSLRWGIVGALIGAVVEPLFIVATLNPEQHLAFGPL